MLAEAEEPSIELSLHVSCARATTEALLDDVELIEAIYGEERWMRTELLGADGAMALYLTSLGGDAWLAAEL